jgi:hypothetical protein
VQEAANRMGKAVDAHLGDVLPFEALRAIPDPKALVDHLRLVTYAIDRDRTTEALSREPAAASASYALGPAMPRRRGP